MSLYAAPRPPRKKSQPRSPKSGKFEPVGPLDDPEAFAFALRALDSLELTARLIERLALPEGDPRDALLRGVVVDYVEQVAHAVRSQITISGAAVAKSWPYQD